MPEKMPTSFNGLQNALLRVASLNRMTFDGNLQFHILHSVCWCRSWTCSLEIEPSLKTMRVLSLRLARHSRSFFFIFIFKRALYRFILVSYSSTTSGIYCFEIKSQKTFAIAENTSTKRERERERQSWGSSKRCHQAMAHIPPQMQIRSTVNHLPTRSHRKQSDNFSLW